MRVLAAVLIAAASMCAAQTQPTVAFKTDIQAATAAAGAGPAAPPPPTASTDVINTAAVDIGVNEKIIDSNVRDLTWVGPEKSGIVLVLSANGILYRSADHGKTWVSQASKIESVWSKLDPLNKFRAVTSIIKSKADPSFLFFTGGDGMHVVSRDAGATYVAVRPEKQLGEIRLHPTNTELVLAAALSDRCGDSAASGACYKLLYSSQDGGQTWKFHHRYVVQFDWAHSMHKDMAAGYPEETVLFSALAEQKGGQRFGKWDHRVDLFVTTDLFVTSTVVLKRGNRFLFTDIYLAIAQVDPSGKHVSLVVSGDGGRTTRAVGMPYEIKQHSYTILDTSEGTVFLHVNHEGDKAKWGNVYASNALGTNFSLSLPYNRRDENGKCDFEKLQSLEGVYVANYYDNAEELEKANQHRIGASSMGQDSSPAKRGKKAAAVIEPVVRTVITFDKGAVWEYLNPPKLRANGAPIRCQRNKHCSLHLHGVTDVFGPFYATETAVGMMMATGCVGDRLCFREGAINTYLSRDGGHEWFEVASGSHIYEFGDHGGLIVVAFDEHPVKEVAYSWDEGATWEVVSFATTPVLVDNIMIEPGSTSTSFLIYGTRESTSGGRSGAIFQVDFAELHTRTCKGVDLPDTEESDFETWTPSAGPNQDGCLLGHRVQYTRRKREARCFNGEELERSTELEHCQCEDRDYECDVGYKRDLGQSGTCTRDPMVSASAAIPMPCPPGSTYIITDGHRKVAGDTCVGGVVHPGVTALCPNSAWHQHLAPSRWFVLGLTLLIAFGLCFAQYSAAVGRSRPKSCIPATLGCAQFSARRLAGGAAWLVGYVRECFSAGASKSGGGWNRAKAPFGGSMSAGEPERTEYKKMSAEDGQGPLPWDDESLVNTDGDGEDFQFDGDGTGDGDALEAAFAELQAGAGDDDLLGASPAPAAPAHVPRLSAPRKAD